MSDSKSGGVGFLGMFFLVLLVLKLTNTIQLSWWWVTAPLWGGVAIMFLILLVIGLIALIVAGKN